MQCFRSRFSRRTPAGFILSLAAATLVHGTVRAAFNALVEVLQQAMDAQGIAFPMQNRLLAQLAPMHRDIINVR